MDIQRTQQQILYAKFDGKPSRGQEQMQVQLPGASKFCSRVSENRSSAAWWESEI